MHAFIRDIVDYEENRRASPIIKAMIKKYGRIPAHRICSGLAGWLKSQGNLKQSHPEAKKEVRPLKIDPAQENGVRMRRFIDESALAQELFMATETRVDFRPEIAMEERFAIAAYVNENFHPRLFSRPRSLQ